MDRKVFYGRSQRDQVPYFLDKEQDITFSPDVRLNEEENAKFISEGSTVRCLRIECEPNVQHLTCFLVLRYVREHIYARIGIVKVQNHAESWFKDAQLDRVIIV